MRRASAAPHILFAMPFHQSAIVRSDDSSLGT